MGAAGAADPLVQLAPQQPGSVSRTVSRSPSDASLHSHRPPLKPPAAVDMPMKTTVKKKKATKIKNRLLSTEKAAVAAMLSLKSSSDDSDGDEEDDSTLGGEPAQHQNENQQLEAPEVGSVAAV